MSPQIDRVIRLRNLVSIVFFLISVLGFLLPLFTNIVTPIHEWAIQHPFTAISFITFASAGIVMWSSTPRGTVDQDVDGIREVTEYVASDREKRMLEKRRLAYQQILLVLVPAITIGFVFAVAFLEAEGFLPDSMFSRDPLDIQGTFVGMKVISWLMTMIYIFVLGLTILVVHHAAIEKRYYSDLGKFYKAQSVASKVQFTRRIEDVEELEAKDKSGAYVKAELEYGVSVSRLPTGLTTLFVVPSFMSFLLPSLLTAISDSSAQPSELLIRITLPFLLLFGLVSFIFYAAFLGSLRRLESAYGSGFFPWDGTVASQVSVARTLVSIGRYHACMKVFGFSAAFFCMFPIQGIYALIGLSLASSALLLSEWVIVLTRRACVRILTKFPKPGVLYDT